MDIICIGQFKESHQFQHQEEQTKRVSKLPKNNLLHKSKTNKGCSHFRYHNLLFSEKCFFMY
jgi:hypothetical protein